MSYRRARALDTLMAQVNSVYPLRDRASDGWIGDAAHRNRVSDHNPNAAGVVTAQDIDDDIAPGVDSWLLANELLASGDDRIKYVISHGKISNPDRTKWADPATRWIRYTGANAHRSHLHLSVTATGADITRPWNLPALHPYRKEPPAMAHTPNDVWMAPVTGIAPDDTPEQPATRQQTHHAGAWLTVIAYRVAHTWAAVRGIREDVAAIRKMLEAKND